jgi:hypothetical protein
MKIAFIIPPNYDYLCASIIEGLIENKVETYTNEDSNYGIKLSRNNFIKYANLASYVFISSGKLCDYSVLKHITNTKIIYIDGSDLPSIENIFFKNYLFIFKREFLKINTYHNNQPIHPLPFAVENRYYPKQFLKKDLNLSFISSTNNFFRRTAFYALKKHFNNNSFIGSTGEIAYNGIDKAPINSPIYYNLLNRSLISINIPGKGWDCSRYWEIIANKSCLLTYRLEIEIPNSFIENVHYFAFNSIDEMIEKSNYLINNPSIAIETAERAFIHLQQFHTTKARVKYLLNLINSNSYLYNNTEDFIVNKIYPRFYYKLIFYLYKTYKLFISHTNFFKVNHE